jgi:hypothetical protein
MNVRSHRVLVRVLLALAVVTGLVWMFALWANRQALNTDNWTTTSSRLLANKNIQNALGAYLVDQLFTSVNVQQQLQNVLPPQAQAIAGPAAAGLKSLATQRAPIFLARPRVQDAWETANRAAHKELLTILNGGTNTVSTHNGEVVLNTRALVTQLAADVGLQQQVAAAQQKLQGGAGAQARKTAQQKLGITLPPATGQLVILKSNQLSTAQDVAQGIRHLAIILGVVTLGLFTLAVWLARGWRREALRATGWCFIGLGVVVLFARNEVGNHVVASLASAKSVQPAAHSAWTIGTSLLHDIAIATVLYGVVIVLGAWLAGPTRAATAVRRAVAPAMRERPGMVYGAVAFVYLLVLLWSPTYATKKLWGIILLGALLALGVEVLRRQIARDFPDAQPGETTARMKAWYAGARGRPAPRMSVESRFDELDRLSALHDKGVLSDEEFDAQKTLILNGS